MNFDSTKNYSPANVGDNPVVNLACGRLRFGFDDGAIGGNSYAIGVSHVYNSLRYHDDQTVGNGWQLSVMQRVFRHGQNYLVVDASGETHCFKPYYANKYYDETNARSVLTADENGFVLSDEVGNKVAFNADGLPVSVTSAVNSKIEKVFAYQDGRLVSIYDKRKVPSGQTRAKDRVEFSYQDDKLAEMRFIVKNKPVSAARYTYQGDNLVSVSKVAFTDNGVELLEKQFMKFAYDSQNRLVAVTDAETLDAMRFTYNSGGALFKTESGFVTQDGLSAGQGISLGQIQATEPKEQFVCVTSKKFYYHTYHSESGVVADFVNKTVVEDEKGISLAYYIDSNFNIVSQFELVDGSLKTLQKEEGKRSGITGEEIRDYINQEPVLRVSKEIGKEYSSDKVLQIARNKAEQEAKIYGYSFWLKHNDSCERMWAELAINRSFESSTSVDDDYTATRSIMPINGRATGGWQKVTIPFEVPEHEDKVSTECLRKFSLRILKDNGSLATDFYIREIGFVPASIDLFCVNMDGIELPWTESLDTVQVDFGIKSFAYHKGTADYMTNGDFNANVTNFMIAKNLFGKDTFEIICNNGKKRIFGATKLEMAGMLHFTNLQYALMCNFSTYGARSATSTQFNAKDILSTNIMVATVDEDEKDVSSSASVKCSYYGNILRETDEYGLYQTYAYDEYGNLVEQAKYTAADKQISKVTIRYDADKEYEVSRTNGKATKQRTLDSHGNAADVDTHIDGTDYSLKTRTTYDIFRKKPTSNLLYSNFDEQDSFYKLTYQNGTIRTISDGTVKYGRICTRKSNEDSVAYTQFTQSGAEEILRKDTVQKTGTNNQDTLYKTEFYGENGKVCYTKSTHADKYGRTKNVDVNGSTRLQYAYDTESKSSKLADVVASVADNALQMERVYQYDSDGKCTGWKDYDTTTQNRDYVKMSVQKVSPTQTKYILRNNSMLTQKYIAAVEYDQSKLLNPRVACTKVYSSSTPNTDMEFAEIDYSIREYVYDDQGRINSVRHDGDEYNGLKDEYNGHKYVYKTDGAGNDVVGQVSFFAKRGIDADIVNSGYTNDREYENGYLAQSNHTWTTYEELSGKKQPYKITTTRRNHAYQCDKFGRLTKETISNGDSDENSYLYQYLPNGRYAKFANKSCLYNGLGQMRQCGDTFYEYDAYGNRVKKIDGATSTQYTFDDKEQLRKVDNNEYFYDFTGNRVKKKLSDGMVVSYQMDGNKILAEFQRSDTKIVDYFYHYDAEGLLGFNVIPYYGETIGGVFYAYVFDGDRNVTALYKYTSMYSRKLVALYDYDAFGNCTVYDENGVVNTDPNFVGNINPFRWKSYYFDVESGLYYINGSYFDPKNGQYVNSRQISSLFDKILHGKGLDRRGILCNNVFTLAVYLCNICDVTDLSPDLDYDPTGTPHWWQKVLNWVSYYIFFGWLGDTGKLIASIFLIVASIVLAVVTYGASVAVVNAAAWGTEATLSAATISLASMSSTAINMAVSIFSTAMFSMVENGLNIDFSTGTFSWNRDDAVDGLFSGCISGMVTGIAVVRGGPRLACTASMAYSAVNQVASTKTLSIGSLLYSGFFAYFGACCGLTKFIGGICISSCVKIFLDIVIGIGINVVEDTLNDNYRRIVYGAE